MNNEDILRAAVEISEGRYRNEGAKIEFKRDVLTWLERDI